MKPMQQSIWLAVLLMALTLTACDRQRTLPASTSSTGTAVESTEPDARTGAIGSGSSIRSTGMGDDDSMTDTADTLIIYFEYDRSEVSPQYVDVLAGHARRLAQNPDQRMRLEGHADERGSREYNIGLGERRAQAVRRVLLLSGATARQISTVSYGEERPVALGSTESDYEKNRRVELSYR